VDSGIKVVVTNTRERAVSDDINRQQAFLGAGLGEFLRYLLDVSYGSDDAGAGAFATEFTTQESPLRAEVIGGLLVRPQLGNLLVAIDPGVLYCIDPGASPSADDSVYKFVKDVGVTIGAGLQFAPGAVGTRVDVVECARFVVTSESDNRDIFNPATSLFQATTVTKATQSQLVYRIRQGTPGGGFPGTQPGWLPLCVASIPSTAVSCDAMTFWDVRPLLSDRWPSIQNSPNAVARPRLMARFNGADPTSTGGLIEAAMNGRRLGGKFSALNLSTPSAATLWDPNMSGSTAGTIWHLYLATPFGLPRWATYTPSSSGSRVPQGPRGIPILSPAPGDPSGIALNLAGPVLPPALGLGAVMLDQGAQDAVEVAAGVWTGTSPQGVTASTPGTDYLPGGGAFVRLTGTVVAGRTIEFVLVAGTHFPAAARSLRVQLNAAYSSPFSSPNVEDLIVTMTGPGGAPTALFQINQSWTGNGVTSPVQHEWQFEIPVGGNPTVNELSSYTLSFRFDGTIDPTLSALIVYGWSY
jgi:hypothetical protein